MNFEQNFNPLEPGSEEYQSLDIAPLSNPLLGETLPELQTVTRKLASREVPLPKKISAEIRFEPAVTDEVRSTYNVIKQENDYFGKLLSSKRDSFSPDSAEYNDAKGYITEVNKLNQPDRLKERVELLYDASKKYLDIESDDATRNSFIRTQYAPAYFSTSKNIKQEYDASPLSSELSPRQYTGLKSLTYGKQSEYNDIVSTLTSPESTDVDKQIAKYKLDKLGAYIDIDAAAKMVNDSGYEVKTDAGIVRNQDKKAKDMAKTGMDLYNASVQSLPIIDDMIREVEYQNPYNKTVLLNNIDNTFKRGLLIGEEADIVNAAVDGSGIDADRLAEIQRLKEEAKSSKALEEFLNTLSFDSFSKNPVGILSELITESFVALYRFGSTRMAAGAAVGAPLGPGGTAIGVTAGMGAASLGLEKSGVILEELQNRGYNTRSAEDIKKAFSDDKLMSELVKEGYKKGIPIAIFDMLSMGIAGKLISKPARTVGGRILRGLGEVGIQASLGGGGEIAGQIVQKGKVTDWAGVVAEVIAEVGTGGPDIAFGAITNKAKNNQQIERKDLVTTVSEMGIDKAFENVDVMIGSGSITAQQGENIKQRLKETAEQVAKLPSALSTDAKTTIVDLINERDRILAGSENLDDVFKKEANKAAANINDRIATIAREDISSQEKQKEDATKESLRTKQEIIEQGGVSKYQRAEEVQDQETTEADISNRPVSGTQEVAFQKAGPVSIQWEKSPEGKGDPSISARNPIVVEAAQKLKAGEISNEEYRATVSQNSPITPITRFFEPATEQEVSKALSKDKTEKVNQPILDNTVVGLRLDIPAYSNNNTWVVSVHEGATNAGKAISYRNVARITDVNFGVEPKGALSIATGVPKATIGRMFGKWQNIEGATMEEQGENAKKIVQDVVNDPSYVQVGMNPFRHSYFYDRSSNEMGRPIQSAEEVIQIGGLVYAKNPVYGEWTDESYRVKGLLDVKGEPVQFQKSEQVLSIVDGFFSPIEKRILEFKQPKASVQKWKDIVGIKSDEAVFSGMSEWLNSKNPSEQLTREEVAQFINDNRIKSEIVKNFEGSAKYKDEEYVLPGGDKYREILFTLPNLSTKFESVHFRDKNIAVHLRANDRKDVNSNKVLFLEEIQSDWGETAREEGFIKNEKRDLREKYDEVSKKEQELSREIDNLVEQYRKENPNIPSTSALRSLLESGEKNINIIYDEYSKASIEKNRINEEYKNLVGVEKGPYVSNTSTWVKMGLKIALQEAIATGKSRISWTTGKQQNERYRLDKKGMDAFYGDVNNPGIISNVAKALIKELTGKEGNIIDVQINTNEEEDITKRVFNETDVNTLAKYGFRFFREGDELTQEAAIESVNNKRPIFARKEFTTSQPGIEITPELRDAILAGMPQFQKTINNQDNIAVIADEINNLDNTAVDFEMSDLGITAEANVDDLINREGLALKPQVIEISDFKGIPVMVTISDELTTGAVINPVTGNIVPNLAGGIGFNYSEGNTGYAWAYTDEATANDTFNTAKEIYNRKPELYPDGIVPVAVVKMGTQAMNSNEAIFRVFIENISTLPAKNLQNAYKAYQKDVESNIKRLENKQKTTKLKTSEKNELNGYTYIRDVYLKDNKNIFDVINNIKELNINTRPLVINRMTAGDIGGIPADNRLSADKPAAKELVKGLTKEDIKKIHLGHIGEILRDNSIKNIPINHIISFVGIDINAEGPVKIDTHPNYPYALRGRGIGVVKNTAHLASVMPTAYANSIKKVGDAALKGQSITIPQAVSRALTSGLPNIAYKGKTLSESISNMEKLTGFLNLSFPKVTFFNDQQSFEDIMSSPNVKKYVRNGEIVYGLTTNGNIYLNPSIATMNTAIHEMGHIWTDFVENTNKPLFKKGIELVEGTKELEMAISQLGDNTAARKEALAMLIGNRGENITNAAQKSKFKEWLVGMWKYLQKKFPELRKLNVSQIGNLSLEQFLGGALRDILGGTIISEDPSTYTYQDVKKMSGIPSWFDNTPGAQKILVTKDFINDNPDLADVLRDYLFKNFKNNKNFRGNVKSLRDAIDSAINKENIVIDAQYAKNIIVTMYKATPKSKANIAKTISMLKAAERMHSLFNDKTNVATKDDIKKSIEKTKEYTEDEKNILYGIVDDILSDEIFKFIDSSSTEALKYKNYYSFTKNILKSKNADAFVHEVGHWGFYNILTPEERVEFFQYASERFAKSDNKIEEEQAWGKPIGRYETNANEDFMEYFAEQFRQYYFENKIDDNRFIGLFKRLSEIVDKILDRFRKTGYNKELVKYFDKIIDARPKKTEQIIDSEKMGGIVPFEPQLPEWSKQIILTDETGPLEEGIVPSKEGAGAVEKKKYDWQMGDRAEAAKGEQMIKTSTGRYVATETMRAQIMDSNKVLQEIEKAKESWFKKILNDTKVGMLDNQYRVLSLLQSIGRAGQLVSSYLRTRNSASATATMMAEKAVKDIYGNVSKKKKYQFGDQELTEYQLFNRVIGYQRVISIQNQMDQTYRDMISAAQRGDISEFNKHEKRLLDNGMIDKNRNYVGVDENGKFVDPVLETEFALGQVTATQSIKLLEEVRSVVGEEDFNKFMKLSESYSQYFNGMMKDRMEAGLISVDTYEYLSKFFYAPTRYINNILLDPILSLATPTTSNLRDKTLQLKDLAGGSERLNLNDYEGLLRATTYASEYSIAENRSTNRFFDLVQENKENFEKNGIKIGVNYIPIKDEQIEQSPMYIKMKQIAEGKKPSMDKALPSGQKMLPYKGVMVAPKLEIGQVRIMEPNVEVEVDDAGNKFRVLQVPLKAGEDYIKVYKDGRRVDLIVPAWFADAWYNRNMPSTKKWSFIGKVTGSNLLRVVATGINPVFGVAQLIPDTISAYVSTSRERRYMPLLIDYPVFFIKTLAAAKDIKNNSNDYIEANKYGATTNFYNGGMVTFERGLLGQEDKSLEKVIEEWNVPGLKQYIMGSKKITETTEQMSKVALYKEIRDSKIAAFTKENGLAPIGQDLEDIRIEAASASRATADFHRKGTVGSQLNMVIPYLNAAIQVQRAVIGSTKQNPFKVLAYTMEFAGYGIMIMLSALGRGDDDELKEKKRIAWSKLSDFDKDNRVPLYFVESKGKFVSVKLPQFVAPLWTLIRRATEQIYKGDGYDYSDPQFSKDARAVVISTIEQFPLTQFINLEKVASRNPMYSGMSKMYNRDPYRQEEVVAYEKATLDYLEGAKIGERRAAQIYQIIGKAAVNPLLPEGISPKRLEAAANTIPFENNPFSGVIIAATEFATSEKDLFEERFGKDALSVILKASGISQRYFKEGSKINQDIVDMPMQEVRERGSQREKIASMLVPRLEEKMNTMTAEQSFKAVRDEFISKEYKTLDPESKKIAESYIKNELKALAISSKNKLDPMVNQIVKMTTSDAKINAMVKTLNEIKISDESKMKFVGDMFESKIFESPDLVRRLAERGRLVLTNGEQNPYYENKVGMLRDMMLRYRGSKSGE